MRHNNSFGPILILVSIYLAFYLFPALGESRSKTLNDFLIEIDVQNGRLLKCSHPQLGTLIQSSPDKASLLIISYPIPSFLPLQLESKRSVAAITEDPDRITLKWDIMAPSRTHVALPTGQIKAVVEIYSATDGKSIDLQCTIDNQSSGQVYQTLFPDLAGLYPFDTIDQVEIRTHSKTFFPFSGPVLPIDRDPFYAPYIWLTHPIETNYPWIKYGLISRGVKIEQVTYNGAPANAVLTFRDEADPTFLRLVWRHGMRINPGETWTSGIFRITPYE